MIDQRVLSKKGLDEVFWLTRAYYHDDHTDETIWRPMICKRIEVAIELTERCDTSWDGLLNLIDGIYALMPDAANETVYKVLEVLGWQVSDT